MADETAPAASSPAAPQVSSKPAFAVRAKVLVLPVVVAGAGEPAAAAVEALAKGLRDNLNWDVTVPGPNTPLAVTDTGAVDAALDAAAAGQASGTSAVKPLQALFSQFLEASTKAPLGPKGTAALVKLGGSLLSAQVAAGQDDAARITATDLKLLLPGHALTEADGLSFIATAVLAAAPTGGVPTEFRSNPADCSIEINGFVVGKGVVQVALRSSSRYSAVARCEGQGEKPSRESFPRVVSVQTDPAAASSKFVLDAFVPENIKATANGLVLTFDTSEHRMALEELYVRRLAERYGASSVVLASVGQFQSAEWLNARLYLSNGYKNRQGLARLELGRVTALGRYLATGRESPGVLNAEEAGNMVASSRTLKPLAAEAPKVSPWYSDVAGWSFIAAGAVSLSLGLWADGRVDQKHREAALSVMDPFRRDKLNTDASNLKFLSSIGTFGGVILLGSGVILLVLPEYSDTHSELFGFAPVAGGAQAVYGGKF